MVEVNCPRCGKAVWVFTKTNADGRWCYIGAPWECPAKGCGGDLKPVLLAKYRRLRAREARQGSAA